LAATLLAQARSFKLCISTNSCQNSSDDFPDTKGHVTESMTAHYSTVGLDEKKAVVAGVSRLVPLTQTVDRAVDAPKNEKGQSEVAL
jgi:hypothetical protein